MTAKETIHNKLTRWSSRPEKAELRLNTSSLAYLTELGVFFLLAAVLSGAAIFQRGSPFAIALVAASGPGGCGGAALVGASFGYMMLMDFSVGLRYVSASILTFAVAFAFYDWKQLQRPWVMPVIAGMMNAGTGFVYLSQGGWRLEDGLYFAGEVLLTVVAAQCYRWVLLPLRTGRWGDPRAASRKVGASMLLCTVLMALEPVTLFRIVSLGRLLAAAAAQAVAWQGGSAVGAMLGVTVGLSMDLAAGGIPLCAMAYGLAALAAGSMRGRGRAWASLAYGAAAVLVWLWTGTAGLPESILLEALLGAVVLTLLPRAIMMRLGAWLAPEETGVAADLRAQQLMRQKLEGAAAGFRTLYESVSAAFRVPDNNGDVTQIYHRASAQVCKGCARRAACWERSYVTTFNALNDATAALVARGRGEPGDFPAYFSGRCLHFSDFLGAVNRELSALLYRRQYNSRIQDSRMAVARQYAQLSELLGSAAAELAQELIPDQSAQRKLRQRLRSMGLEVRTAVFRDGRNLLRCELSGPGCQNLNEPSTLKELSALLGAPLRAEGGGDCLTLLQQEPLMAVAGVAARKKDGEVVSGDVGTYFKGPDGSLYVLLCDGMGSGPAANRESSLAVRLLEQFLQAGVETEHALVTLSSALALRGEETGGFTTVDLLRVDLFTGRGAVYKMGAAPTYLRRGREVRRITGSALPAGLSEGRGGPDKIPVQLAPGDCVLMVSDGIAGTGDDGWIRERFAAFDGKSPKELARDLIARSPQEVTDDRTALMIRIEQRKPG